MTCIKPEKAGPGVMQSLQRGEDILGSQGGSGGGQGIGNCTCRGQGSADASWLGMTTVEPHHTGATWWTIRQNQMHMEPLDLGTQGLPGEKWSSEVSVCIRRSTPVKSLMRERKVWSRKTHEHSWQETKAPCG